MSDYRAPRFPTKIEHGYRVITHDTIACVFIERQFNPTTPFFLFLASNQRTNIRVTRHFIVNAGKRYVTRER